MTAAWCITCKINERVAIRNDNTTRLFEMHNVLYIEGDWTNRNGGIAQYLESFGRNGVPLYVFYGAPDPKTGKRPKPQILPQILTPTIIAKAINTHY
jgi:thiol:disulfide interchange protein DsbD